MAIGDIGSVIDSLTFDGWSVFHPRIIHVTGDIYLIGHRGASDNSIFVRTVSIDSAGDIGASVIDSLELDSGAAGACGGVGALIHISGDVYCAVYISRTQVVAQTFDVDSDGNIGAAIDSYAFSNKPSTTAMVPWIEHVTGDIFVVDYTDAADDGWMETIVINPDGTFGSILDSWEWETSAGARPFIRHITGEYFLHIAEYRSARGHVEQVQIASSGVITQLTTYLIFDQIGFLGGTLHHVSGDVYVIFYEGPDVDGWMATVECNFSDIPSLIDSWEFDDTYGMWPRAVEVSENEAGDGKVYCVLHGTSGDLTNVCTIEVLNDGTITKTKMDTLQLDSVNVQTGQIIHISGNIFAAAYRGASGLNGYLKTFDITRFLVPTVTTDPATSIGQTTATLNATLSESGGEDCSCSFEYGRTTEYGKTTSAQTKGGGEEFSQEIRGLDPSADYHFRAVATNSAGTGYGDDRTLRTSVLSAEAHQALGKHHALGRKEI